MNIKQTPLDALEKKREHINNELAKTEMLFHKKERELQFHKNLKTRENIRITMEKEHLKKQKQKCFHQLQMAQTMPAFCKTATVLAGIVALTGTACILPQVLPMVGEWNIAFSVLAGLLTTTVFYHGQQKQSSKQQQKIQEIDHYLSDIQQEQTQLSQTEYQLHRTVKALQEERDQLDFRIKSLQEDLSFINGEIDMKIQCHFAKKQDFIPQAKVETMRECKVYQKGYR